MVPVQTTDYIMDVVSSMERQGFAFSLYFRRVLWLQGLRLDNELLVSVIYYQVKPVKQVFPQFFSWIIECRHCVVLLLLTLIYNLLGVSLGSKSAPSAPRWVARKQRN